VVGAAALIGGLAACAPEQDAPIAAPQIDPRVLLTSVVARQPVLDPGAVSGLFPQRIVPSGTPWVSARWSQLPGENEFNTQLLEWVHAETDEFVSRTGGPPFETRASPVGSGGASRGCVAGSTEQSAEELLANPSLSAMTPAGTAGLALNCDLIFASGGWLAMRLRSTSVDAEGMISDTLTTWYSMDAGAVAVSALFNPANIDELGTVLLAGLGVEGLPDIGVPASLSRAISEEEIGQLGLAQLVSDAVPTADGAREITVSLDQLPVERQSLFFRAGWADWVRDGAVADGRITVRLAQPAPWLSDQGAAIVASAVAGLEPTWQALPAGRQTVDCSLVPCVAVTFDDGPGHDSERLLQILAEGNSAASFFLLGSLTTGAGAVAAAEAAAGHTVANHSWNHPDLTTLTSLQVAQQVSSTQLAITAATGETPRYFRPPYGALNERVTAQIPLSIVLWSIDTKDWQVPGEEALVERVAAAQPGDIILFHDTQTSTVEAMPRVIAELRDRGLELVTIDRLLGEQPAGVRVFHG
jgi:peptidoglycan/xylan/chitin deacetylase (PgdA/CDA1 family)